MTATDEDGCKAETFIDKDGKTILTRELLGAEWLETWYAYDEKGQLRYVFPPELTKESNFWTNPEGVEKYAWRFNYDKEGRMVGQKAPGCEPVTYKYEPFYDRLVAVQDGALREKGESIVFTYDKQGRLQNTALVAKWEHGTSILYLEAFSYDSQGNNFVPTPGYSQDYSENTAGKMTSRLAYLIYAGNNTFVQTNYYYDSEGRIIQQVEKTLSRTTLRTDYKYDFTGNLVAVREAHTYEGKTDVVEQLMRYDERGRIKETSLSLNGTPCAKVYCTYDHAGRLAGKIAGKASQVFRYNTQGWLTEMEGSAFSYKLRYENPEGDTPARWNGNISEWEWRQGTDSPLMYAFQYDGMERLTGAGQWIKEGNEWKSLDGNYVEKGITYDRNGNILTLQRTANGTTVDDLSYSYNGNLLESVTENVRTSPDGDIYAPGSSVSATFEYDENGNLVKNGHLGLEFQYNCLNLPWFVKRDGKTLATFYYLGDGTKARAVDSVGVARYNIGSLTYRQEGSRKLVLEEIAFDGGIVKVGEDGTPETFYCITDHLGSVRAMVDADGNAVERNDYYPFGAQHARADYPQIANRYKFNGKEREKAGGADWLDYGARRYDPTLARWTTPDPLGDSYLPYSPYHFSGNNPVNYIDWNGMDYWGTNNPAEIERFWGALAEQGANTLEEFDFSSWENHISDKEFLDQVASSLWFDDEDRKFYSYYGLVINNVATVRGLSFPELRSGVSLNSAYYDSHARLDFGGEWYKKASGKANQDYTLDALLFPIGKLGTVSKGLNWVGKTLGSLFQRSVYLKLSNKAVEKGVNFVMSQGETKLKHLFAQKHNLDGLVQKLGSEENVVRAVLKASKGKLPKKGVFIDLPVDVAGETVFLRGSVIKGIPKIGTMFKPNMK